jgi:hypothetical protein
LGDGEIDIARTHGMHAMLGLVDQPGDRGSGRI